MKKYYEAYDERYKTIHQKGELWFGDKPSKIVYQTIEKYRIANNSLVLELGCGEGRDAHYLLKNGFSVTATDVSAQAITKCKELYKGFEDCFKTLDFVVQTLPSKYDFIYAIAVLHMLVLNEDRQAFYSFIREHLKEEGFALITTMGDGNVQMQTDVAKAFDVVERSFNKEKILVAATSCRMVTDQEFIKEIEENGLSICEFGQTQIEEHFSCMSYAIVQKNKA